MKINNSRYKSFLRLAVMRMAFLIIIILAVVHAAPVRASMTDAFFSMDTKYVQPGQTFDVPIQFGSRTGVGSVQFDVIHFDASKLRLNSIREGTYLSNYTDLYGGSTVVTPPVIDNIAGKATGFKVTLIGPKTGSGPQGAGEIAILNFTALAEGKSQTNLGNIILTDYLHGYFLNNVITTGGVIWVGPPPILAVTALTLTPSGTGEEYGYTFVVNFTVANTGGAASDPVYAHITALGATPGYFSPIHVPSIPAGGSLDFTFDNFRLLPNSASAVVSVGVDTDGVRTATYAYTPVVSNGVTNIYANVVPYLRITPPGYISLDQMRIGLNSAEGVINIKCNTSYQVDLYDANPTAWRLTEWDGNAYLTRRLNDPLRVASTMREVTAGSPALLVAGDISGQFEDEGRIFC
jgi:hypothetical protein